MVENKAPVWNQNNHSHQQQQQQQSMSVYKSVKASPQTHHMAAKKPTAYENYEITDLNSSDETDDEEEPSKPIPLWAQDQNLTRRAIAQNKSHINFTKMFKATSHAEVDLEKIFKIKRSKFNERSSSANWTSPPVWSTGINGNESFWLLHN